MGTVEIINQIKWCCSLLLLMYNPADPSHVELAPLYISLCDVMLQNTEVSHDSADSES